MPPNELVVEVPFIDQFNAKFHEEYNALIKDLNRWVCPASGNIMWNLPEIVTIGPPTVIHNQDDATLLLPVAGHTRNVVFDPFKQTEYPRVLVGRILIGWAAAVRFTQGQGSLKPYIFAALKEVCTMKDISVNSITWGNSLLTFNRPGQPMVYGQELEHSAAIELRYFSDCITVDKAKEIMNENNPNPQVGP